MKEKIFETAKKIEKLQQKLDTFDRRIEEENKLYEETIHEIYLEKRNLQMLEQYFCLSMEPSIVGEEIDLYLYNIHVLLEENPETFHYNITIHDTKKVIGNIQVRFSSFDRNFELGNIGAEINKQYRGQRYAYKAFILLKDIMLEHGLVKPIFTVKVENTSSIKSLENMGAKQINLVDDSYYVYEYDLEEDKRKNK